MKGDLHMWRLFLQDLEYARAIPTFVQHDADALQLYTDGSANINFGFGCYFTGQWTYGVWPKEFICHSPPPSIALLELIPIVVSIVTWGKQLTDMHVVLFPDNKAEVSIVNHQMSKCPYCMTLVHILVMNCLHFNIDLKCCYIQGFHNVIANSISHLQWTRFRKLAPTVQKDPSTIPDQIWPLDGIIKECQDLTITARTRDKYDKRFKDFCDFLTSIDRKDKFTPHNIVLFLAHMAQVKYRYSTINQAWSAIKFHL